MASMATFGGYSDQLAAEVSDWVVQYCRRHPGQATKIRVAELRKFVPFCLLDNESIKRFLASRADEYIVFGGCFFPTRLPPDVAQAALERVTAPPRTPVKLVQALETSSASSLHCTVCNISCTCKANMQDHIRGQRHQSAVARASPQQITQALVSTRNPLFSKVHCCELCGMYPANEASLREHLSGAPHLLKQYYLMLMNGPALTSDTASGMHVSQLPVPLPPLAPGASAAYAFALTNTGALPQTLLSARLLQPVDGLSLSDPLGRATLQGGGAGGGGVELQGGGGTYSVTLHVAPRFIGLMRGVVMFEFGSGQAVARAVAASCQDPEAAAAGAGGEGPGPGPGQQQGGRKAGKRKKLQPKNKNYVKGVRPTGSKYRPAINIGKHPVPGWLRTAVERCDWKAVEAQLALEVGSLQQYASKLKLLQWLEELQHEIDIRTYDMESVELSRAGHSGLLVLEVPGLAENRPSVMKGDALFVTPSDGSAGGREWQGYVHVVEREQVQLGFDAGFLASYVRGRRYNVRFAVNRSMFKLMQAALDRVHDTVSISPLLVMPGSRFAPLPRLPRNLPLAGASVFLPGESPPAGAAPSLLSGGGGLHFANALLNEEQRLAVREVVRGAHAPLPYVIFGPPGTGKTSTLVEAAVQLLRTYPSAKLLLCAPSNSAADQLVQRLLAPGVGGRPRSEVLRLCAYSRARADVPADLMDAGGVVNWDDGTGAFMLPGTERIVRARAVAVTCAMAARLYHSGVPAGHFSHVLVDEAGHAEEPLLLCALAGLADTATRVVLAGDPQQLGPIILSPLAKRHGLDVSLLERLTRAKPYARLDDDDDDGSQGQEWRGEAPGAGGGGQRYRTAFITKLLNNYRSHKDILAVPNSAFYDDELRVMADPRVTSSLLHWEGLPNKSVPIVFHQVVGRDLQEATSPSWYNVEEVAQVKRYVDSLRDLRRNPVIGNDIGIITPYRKQVQRIRAQINQLDRSIKVGSVEEFQGQERKVIIISTVRSSDEYISFDARHRLGFLSNPKRFNVAITRAKALLVIVGNAQVLAHDAHWRTLLRYLRDRGAVTGTQLPDLDLFEPSPEQQQQHAQQGGYSHGAAAGGAGAGARRAAGTAAAGPAAAAGGGEEPAALQSLVRSLQRLVLGADRGGGVGGGPSAEEDEELAFFGTLQAEGGEMRHLE